MTNKPDLRNVTYMPVSELNEDSRNPKQHDLPTIDASINRFGVLDLIVLDERTGKIISGHGRKNTLEGMEARGETPPDGVTLDKDGNWLVPVVTGWASRSDNEAAAALIAMNRTTELGGWADESLLQLLDELADTESLDGVGYDTADLDALSATLDEYDWANTTDSDLDDALAESDASADPVLRIQLPQEHYDRFYELTTGDTEAQRLVWLLNKVT